jgi:hypothetical protein
MTSRPTRYRVLERRIVRDYRVPLSADDPDMENGFRAIAVPPTRDEDWFILESSHNDKAKTVWGRWHDAEGCG